MSTKLWLREEVKPFEHRTALTPDVCKLLQADGFEITVEKMEGRCVPDAEYAAAGCSLVEGGTWPSAPKDNVIVGLKELPEDGSELTHQHLYFGHAYKHQDGWKELLGRFDKGGGGLLDLEYLTDEQGQRVAAFGFMAGFAGAAVGIIEYCHKTLNPGVPLPKLDPYPNEDALIKYIKAQVAAVQAHLATTDHPSIIVIGALGRCGTGATTLADKCGFPGSAIVKWDMAETKQGGPFPALMDHNIFVNCIYLSAKIPEFLTEDMLSKANRKLQVIVDVSCDTTNPNNPLPFCNKSTTFENPSYQMTPAKGPPISIVAIDHLPTMLPLESSIMYSNDLLPTIKALKEFGTAPVWTRTQDLYKTKVAESKE